MMMDLQAAYLIRNVLTLKALMEIRLTDRYITWYQTAVLGMVIFDVY